MSSRHFKVCYINNDNFYGLKTSVLENWRLIPSFLNYILEINLTLVCSSMTNAKNCLFHSYYSAAVVVVFFFTIFNTSFYFCIDMHSVINTCKIKTRLYGPRQATFWYLSPMPAAKVQASLRIRAVSPEPPLLAHTSSESTGTFRQKTRSLALPNCWACAVKVCHDGMLEDTNSLDAPHIILHYYHPGHLDTGYTHIEAYVGSSGTPCEKHLERRLDKDRTKKELR